MWGLLRFASSGDGGWARAVELGTEELQGPAGEGTGKEMGRECKRVA